MEAPESDYRAFAQRVIADGWIPDPWVDGAPRLDPNPLVMAPERIDRLGCAAEAVAAVLDEIARMCATEPWCLDWLGLSPWQRVMWWSSAPSWHGFARADVFETASGGVAVCEINADTPSGAAEAVALGRLCAGERDVNRHLMARWVAMVERSAPAAAGRVRGRRAGIVWPTDNTEDLPMILLWDHALRHAGWETVTGAPHNLGLAKDGRATLLGAPCEVVVRHYKTDWWGDRSPVWRDDPPFADPLPLAAPLAALLQASWARRTAIVNPFGAVVPQNKRAYALAWHLAETRPELLSASARAAIAAHVPWTARLEDVATTLAAADRAAWVLKSDYGCEGEEVVCGAHVDEATWRRALDLALPGRWVAQRWFDAVRDGRSEAWNHGVYLVGGRAAGLLARRSAAPTDRLARIAPVAVDRDPPERSDP